LTEKVKERLLKLKPQQPEGYRLKRGRDVAWTRIQIIDFLEKEGPAETGSLALKLGLSYESTYSHLRVLLAGGFICDEIVNMNKPKVRVWTVCPNCPVTAECKIKETKVWRET